ncbi:MAG: acyltransferase [Prosthecobacter sp.]
MNREVNGTANYRPDIDGLRAVAVLPVLFYHAGVSFTGGYVGVDVFFVISGFLITRLLVRDLERGRFSLLEFWHRRVRRIFPALFVMVLFTVVAGGFLMIPADYKELGQSVVAQSLLVANIFFWDDTGYFARAAESKPLLHTWSLAVEEQFYVLFPVVLAWLSRSGKAHARRLLGIALLLSFAASLPGPSCFPTTAFYLLPTRAWELLLGGILVFLPELKKSAAAVFWPCKDC